MIKNLIFDFGKVLVDYSFEKFYDEQYFHSLPLAEEFMRKVFTREWGLRVDREAEPLEQIVAELQALFPAYAEPIAMYQTRHTEFVLGEVPGMRALLTRLKQEGFRLYGLTNWCHAIHETMAQYPEIFALLDGMVISSEEHLVKPEAAIYERLLEKFDLDRRECLFTDDKQENIDGSLRVGMDAILFVDAEQYERELRQRLRASTSTPIDPEATSDCADNMPRAQRVYDYLQQHAIPYTCYHHPEGKTIEEAKRWWHDDGSVHCKNLFFRNHKGNQHYLVCFHCDHDMDIHDLEQRLKASLIAAGKNSPGKLSFASPERMMRYLGLEPGSVSPFGLINDEEHHVHLFLDENLQKADTLSFHPNDCRGTVVIRRSDFERYLAELGNEYQYIKLY